MWPPWNRFSDERVRLEIVEDEGADFSGLALLANIVIVSVLSAPVPFRVFMNEPASVFVTTVPYVWLPAILVQAAWFGHLLVFRNLWRYRGQVSGGS